MSLRSNLLWPLFGALLAVAAYQESFSVPFHFDDFGYSVLANPAVSGERSYLSLYGYYPGRYLPLLSFAFNWNQGGGTVGAFHVWNLAIHVLVTWLVYALIVTVLRKRDDGAVDGATRMIAGVAASLFAVHPLNVQAVAYICQRHSSMTTLFYLGSLLAFIRWRQSATEASGTKPRYLVGALLAGLAAMHSKETAATLPLAWVAADLCLLPGRPWQERRGGWFAAACLMAVPFLLLAFGHNMSMASTGESDTPSSWHYLLTQNRVIVEQYLRLFLWPFGLSVEHDVQLETTPFTLGGVAALAVHVAILGGALLARHRAPAALFGAIFFYLALAPDSSVLPLPDLMYEHRMYLAMVGLLIAGAAAVQVATLEADRVDPRQPRWVLALSLAAVAVLGCLQLTRSRVDVWQSEESLWTDAMAKAPRHIRPITRLALHYLGEKKIDDAIRMYQRGTEAVPTFAPSYNNLAFLLYGKGQRAEAIATLERALIAAPGSGDTYRNLGQVLQEEGRTDDAVQVLRRCLAAEPAYLACHARLAKVLSTANRQDEAAAVLDAAIAAFPTAAELKEQRAALTGP